MDLAKDFCGSGCKIKRVLEAGWWQKLSICEAPVGRLQQSCTSYKVLRIESCGRGRAKGIVFGAACGEKTSQKVLKGHCISICAAWDCCIFVAKHVTEEG